MTVDVEDYFHVSAFAQTVSVRDWDQLPSRVVANTHRLLTLLDKHQTRGTFFVLGWVATRFPQLVRDIQRAGHEIGCHSQWHRLVYDLSPEEFRVDLVQSRDILQDIIGAPVTSYRAPSFSIMQRSRWALEVLASEGFTCDSSIYPVYHDRYGFPEADPAIHQIETPSGVLDEFPGSAIRLCGLRLPVSGGGYFRMYPVQFTKFCLRHLLHRNSEPFMFYIHPWEVDPLQPRLSGSLRSRFRHYQNLASTERKLDWLLPQFRFGTMSESIASSTLRNRKTYALAEGLYRPEAMKLAVGETS